MKGVHLLKKSLPVLAVCVLLTTASIEAATIQRAAKPIKNRYIVMLQDDVLPDQVEAVAAALARQHQGRLLGTMKHAMRGFGVSLPSGAVEGLSRSPLVKAIEEDSYVEIASGGPAFEFESAAQVRRKPEANHHTTCAWSSSGYYLCTYANDTWWHLDRIDNTGLLYSYKAYAYNSSGYSSTGPNVRVYVVDSGVYATHSEFYTGQVETGANMLLDPDVSNVAEPWEEPGIDEDGFAPTNPCGGWQTANHTAGHGTGVASVIGGRTSGVAKHVTIVPVKVVNCGGDASKLAIARGLDWIQEDMAPRSGRAVVNMSTGIRLTTLAQGHLCEDPLDPTGFSNCVSAVEHEVNNLSAQNIPVVVAAMNFNDGANLMSPGRIGYPYNSTCTSSMNLYRPITVGGTMYTATYADQRWTCAATPEGCQSGWSGPNNQGSNYGPNVSIYAPAWSIRVAGAASSSSFRDPGGASSGTSFSAPAVAGAVARLLQLDSTLTTPQVWCALLTRADSRVNPPDFDPDAARVNRRLLYMSPFD